MHRCSRPAAVRCNTSDRNFLAPRYVCVYNFYNIYFDTNEVKIYILIIKDSSNYNFSRCFKVQAAAAAAKNPSSGAATRQVVPLVSVL